MIKLLGVLIVIVGFALGINAIAIIMIAALVTALVGGLGIVGLLDTLGASFIANRSMSIFIIVLLLTGTLERNGLKEAAAELIGKMKNVTSGMLVGAYGIMRVILAAFNVGLGGVAGFVRPVLMPMAVGAIETTGNTPNEEHVEALKGMGSGMENVTWFFGQVLFIGGAGGLLVQATLKTLGINVSLIDLAKVQIPVAIFATIVTAVYYYILDKKMFSKYYGKKKSVSEIKGKENE